MSPFWIGVLVAGGVVAVLALVRALRLGQADPFAVAGRALAREGKYEEACERSAKAVEITPRYAEAYCGWGCALLKQGQYGEACEM